MLKELVEIVQTLSNLLYYFLILSYNIGHVIFSILIFLSQTFGITLTKLGTFLVVFYEDFRIFQNDLLTSLSCIGTSTLKTSETGITSVWDFFRAVFHTFVEAFTTGHVKLSRFGGTSSEILLFIVEKVKHFAILVGNSVWLIMTLLPNLCIYIAHLLYRAIILIGIFCWNTIIRGCQLVFAITIYILDYFKDVPIQSALGLIFMYLCYKHYRFIKPLVNFIKRKTISKFSEINALSRAYVRRQYTIFIFELRNSFGFGLRYFQRQRYRHPRITSLRPSKPQPRPKLNSQSNNNCQSDQDLAALESLLCIICRDRDKCVLLFPCKHLCLCNECASVIDAYENKCPICRVSIYQKIKVFV